MSNPLQISRRRFLLAGAAIGGSLTIGLTRAGAFDVVRAGSGAEEITPWLVIRPDDMVVMRVAYVEMGQGALTGLAQLLAEELECDWNKIVCEYPTPGNNAARQRVWGNFFTGGSNSIYDSQERLRKAGAAARAMLVQAAADAWNVRAAECTVHQGIVSHPVWHRKATYGQLAAAAAKLDLPQDVALKDPTTWKIIGKPMKRLDAREKITGEQVYGADIMLPGMLNATIRDCPIFGGKVRLVDETTAARMPGVKKILRIGDSAVAVVADTWWHAKCALDSVRIEWDAGEHGAVTSESIEAILIDGLNAKDSLVHARNGDSTGAIASAAKRVEAVYGYPFQTHACMEPMNATALYTAERCEVWCPTQDPEKALAVAAEAADLPIARCDIHRVSLGGGFGRRLTTDYVAQAVLIAKAVPGAPVKLLWSREEDIARGRYHPAMAAKLTGGLDSDGSLAGLEIRLSGPSIVAALDPSMLKDGKDPEVFRGYYLEGSESLDYTVSNLTVDHAQCGTHVPLGWWRGVNINHNAIFIECFIDELAHAAGQDTLDFRRKLMGKRPKALAVLDAVVKKGGWATQRTSGRHLGLSQFRVSESYIAALAEISVGDSGGVKVHKVTVAIDPGIAVNPAQIERQIASGVVFGLSALFLQGLTIQGGRMEQDNFDSYDSMRIAQMPTIEAIVMPSGGFWGGVGEAPTCVAAPAVLNAYFAATGKRIRSIPLKNHGIRMV